MRVVLQLQDMEQKVAEELSSEKEKMERNARLQLDKIRANHNREVDEYELKVNDS